MRNYIVHILAVTACGAFFVSGLILYLSANRQPPTNAGALTQAQPADPTSQQQSNMLPAYPVLEIKGLLDQADEAPPITPPAMSSTALIPPNFQDPPEIIHIKDIDPKITEVIANSLELESYLPTRSKEQEQDNEIAKVVVNILDMEPFGDFRRPMESEPPLLLPQSANTADVLFAELFEVLSRCMSSDAATATIEGRVLSPSTDQQLNREALPVDFGIAVLLVPLAPPF